MTFSLVEQQSIKPYKGFTLDYLDYNQREKIIKHLKAGKTLKCHHPKCQSFINNEEFSILYEYNMHCHTNHRKSPLHPELSLIKLLDLEPVGNPWEPDSSSVTIVENTVNNNHSKNLKDEIEKGLDFLLSHFNQERLFPRFITTNKLKGKQIEVFSKEEALNHYEQSNYIDSRCGAFPSFTRYKEVQRYPPDFIFIDLDSSNFETDKQFERSLSKTLINFKMKLNGSIPTVNNSGNGYHIIGPIECPILEQIPEFEKYKDKFFLSQEFLRFAELSLSNYKADPGHHPSFKSCQIRVPNSINSKCLDSREKRLTGNVKVKTIQRWNGIRAHISREFIEDFRTYLEGKIAEETAELDKNMSKPISNRNNFNNDNIDWIEKLLQIPIEDHRKKAIDIIFVPYFLLVKKLSVEETISKITEWLQKCNSIRTLDFDIRYRINAAIKNTNKKQILPMKYNTLKNNYQYLYSLIQNNGAH